MDKTILFFIVWGIAYIVSRIRKKLGKPIPPPEPKFITSVNHIGCAVQAVDQHGCPMWQRPGRLLSHTSTHVSVICGSTGYVYDINGGIAYTFPVDEKDIRNGE